MNKNKERKNERDKQNQFMTNQITKQNRNGIKQGDKDKELEQETILKEK